MGEQRRERAITPARCCEPPTHVSTDSGVARLTGTPGVRTSRRSRSRGRSLRFHPGRPAPAAAQTAPTTTPPPGVAVERIVPEASTISVNDPPFILSITVEQVSNLGVYEVLLLYDPALVQFMAAANGPFLGSTGGPCSASRQR